MSAKAPPALAGYVNAHTHLYSGLAPFGMPPADPAPRNFVEILERVWWRLDRALDEASLRAAARLYVAEALLHGTTTLVDHHESPRLIEGSLDVLADACHELGARALLCYGATERNGGRDEAEQGLAECRRFARDNRRPLVRALVGLHASFTVSDTTLREAAELCAELGVPLHVHVAEDRADVQDAHRRGHAGPLERLLAFGCLPPGSILAHGVHLEESQVREAAARGLWLVQNPRSNQGNRVGYPRALAASGRVALGTDGYPADMPAEARVLERLAREHGAEEVEAAGPRLSAGARMVAERFADAPSALAPADDRVVLDAASGEATRAASVTVGGRVVVADGRLVTGDLDEIRARAREAATGLWRRMEALA